MNTLPSLTITPTITNNLIFSKATGVQTPDLLVKGTLKIEDGKIDEGTFNIIELLLQDKDPREYKKEYLDIIPKIHWVKDNNLKILQLYGRLVTLYKLLTNKRKEDPSNGKQRHKKRTGTMSRRRKLRFRI
jgi:hypothetical protein